MKKRGRMRGKCKRTKRHKQIQGETDGSEDIQVLSLVSLKNQLFNFFFTTIPFKEDSWELLCVFPPLGIYTINIFLTGIIKVQILHFTSEIMKTLTSTCVTDLPNVISWVFVCILGKMWFYHTYIYLCLHRH